MADPLAGGAAATLLTWAAMPGLTAAVEALHRRKIDSRDHNAAGIAAIVSSEVLVSCADRYDSFALSIHVSLAATMRKLLRPSFAPHDNGQDVLATLLIKRFVRVTVKLDGLLADGSNSQSSRSSSSSSSSGDGGSSSKRSMAQQLATPGCSNKDSLTSGDDRTAPHGAGGVETKCIRRSQLLHQLQAITMLTLLQACHRKLNGEAASDVQASREWLDAVLGVLASLHNSSLKSVAVPLLSRF
ncbi:MAG: hypothetical protein WDW38_010643 [Sanguina aurantia]